MPLTREQRIEKLMGQDTLVLLHALRRRLEDEKDYADRKALKALPFVQAAIDAYIGYSLVEHRMHSVQSNGEYTVSNSKRD